MTLSDDSIVHRLGGGHLDNLRISPPELELDPPGISVLIGGTAQEAATAMRQAFPRSRRWRKPDLTVGSTTLESIRAVGFDVIAMPTTNFTNHARLVHQDGSDGFSTENLNRLATVFTDTHGC